jgi:hypothetical protein
VTTEFHMLAEALDENIAARAEIKQLRAQLDAVLALPDRRSSTEDVDEPGDWATGFYTGYNAGLAAAKGAIEITEGPDDRP